MHPLTGLITLLTVLLLMVMMALVARARGQHNVKAPATTGPGPSESVLLQITRELGLNMLRTSAQWFGRVQHHFILQKPKCPPQKPNAACCPQLLA